MNFNSLHTITASRDTIKKNPYKIYVKLENAGQKFLSGFFTFTDSYFGDVTVERDQESPEKVTASQAIIHTIEWDLKQSPYSLLKKDFRVITTSWIPTSVKSVLKRIQAFILVFFQMGEMIDDVDTMILTTEEVDKIIRMRQGMDKVITHQARLIRKSSHAILSFRDAIKIIMLKSLGKIKRMPAYLARISSHIPFLQRMKNKNIMKLPASLLKNIIQLFSYKRN